MNRGTEEEAGEKAMKIDKKGQGHEERLKG